MKIKVIDPVDYDGRTWLEGVHDVSEADAGALFARGRVRPATMDEIETAEASSPARETAASRAGRKVPVSRIAEPASA